ncbi:cytochrome c oxidase assembly factor Coa1 family protein [Rasiella sp. SM2506]|uniref:cytochrome c oxidase assembly factor Coa1 family protein n=1 Tax=Rasiella sp. SM2506 TaxID=3423914 RepID=UPI003D7A2A81
MEETVHKQSWWKRNWKWALPTGGCLTIIVLIVAFAGTLFFGITSLMEDSDAYKQVLFNASKNQELIASIGEPITQEGIIGGSINNSNGFKTSELTIPLKGPNGAATVRVEGSGVGDTWTYTVMDAYIEGSDIIVDLLHTATHNPEETPELLIEE